MESVVRRYNGDVLTELPAAWAPDEIALRNEEAEVLSAAVAMLPVADRVALVMAARGATGLEIASEIGRSHLATRALLSRARGRLRTELAATWARDAA